MAGPWWGPAAIGAGGSLLGGLLGGGGGGGAEAPYSIGTSSQFGSGGSSQSSYSQSTSSTKVFPDIVWPEQAGHLGSLYSQAMGKGGVDPGIYNLFNQGAGALGNIASGLPVNPMMDAYANRMGEQFREQIMPSIQGSAIQAGGFGGSRQGIAEGQAATGFQRNMQDFARELYGQDLQASLTAAMGIPSMIGAGLGIPWYNMQQQAGILGQPVVLDQGSKSKSQSTSYSSGSSSQVSGGSSRTVSGPDRSWVEGGGRTPPPSNQPSGGGGTYSWRSTGEGR